MQIAGKLISAVATHVQSQTLDLALLSLKGSAGTDGWWRSYSNNHHPQPPWEDDAIHPLVHLPLRPVSASSLLR